MTGRRWSRRAARAWRRGQTYAGTLSYVAAACAVAFGIAVWKTLPAEASDSYGMRACDRLGASTGWPPAEVAASVWMVGKHARTESIREHAERLDAAAPAETRIAPPGWEKLLFDMIDACLEADWRPKLDAPADR